MKLDKIKTLLIVAHTPSPNTIKLAKALFKGAQHPDVQGVNIELISPFDCDAEKVINSDAIILFTTENFGYMSGALKDFFERIYYPCLEKTQAMPFALVIRAGLDGTGTQTAVHKITNGLKWKEIQPVTLCKGDYHSDFEQDCDDLALTVAAGLELEIF